MAIIWCHKHNTMSFRDSFARYKNKETNWNIFILSCGCQMKRSNVESNRVHTKRLYFLSDGTEIERIPPETNKIIWKIKSLKEGK